MSGCIFHLGVNVVHDLVPSKTKVQWLLNCGSPKPTNLNSTAIIEENQQRHYLSCHGGSALHAYEYIYNTLLFVPEESCLSYLACSDDSDEGFCPLVREWTSCTMDNVCRGRRRRKTCHPHDDINDGHIGVVGGAASARLNNTERGRMENDTINDDDCWQDHDALPLLPDDIIPNVTIAEFGSIEAGNIHAIQAEIFARYRVTSISYAITHGKSHKCFPLSQSITEQGSGEDVHQCVSF